MGRGQLLQVNSAFWALAALGTAWSLGSCSTGCGAGDGGTRTRQEHYSSGALKAELQETRQADGSYVLNGWHRTWYENGQLQSETYYLNGVPHGPMSTWYRSGQKQTLSNVVAGEPEGEALCWHENGQLAGKGVLKAGKRHGLWTTWDENGNKIDEMEFQMGTPHGRAARWRPDGTKEYEGTYREGQKDGVWRTWNRGQYRQELWVNGKQVAE